MPRVVTKIKFAQITVQVLLSYMVVYTVNAPLENRKIALNRICANQYVTFFAGVDLPSVANCAVTTEMLAESAVARMLVRHNVGIARDVLFHYLLQSLATDHVFMERA